VKKILKTLALVGLGYVAINIALANTQAGGLLLQVAAQKNSGTLTKLFVFLGANVDDKNAEGLTALHVAGFLGAEQAIDVLVLKGATVNATDKDNRTPLHLAAYEGRTDAVKSLLRHGANIEARENANGMTAIHLAAVKGSTDVVQALIDNNADVNALANNDVTPLLIANQEKKIAVADLLENNGAEE